MDHHDRNQRWMKPNGTEADYVELASANSYPLGDETCKIDSTMHLAPSKSYDSPENEEPNEIPLWQAVRRYPKMVGYCFALTTAVVGWGYDLAVVGSIPGVDSFKNDYGRKHDGEMIIPGMWLSLFLGLPAAAQGIGSIVAGWLQDRIGRKFSLMTGSIISGMAVSVIFFSFLPESADSKRSMFTIGITFQGFSVGIIKTVCLTYVSENAPTAIRGSAMALFPTFTLLGQLIGFLVLYIVNGLEGSNGYLGAFGSQWVLSLSPFIISCVMPDSPAYHLRKDNAIKARRAATRLFAPKVDPAVMLKQYRDAIEEERAMTAGIGFHTCFQALNLRRTLIVMLANVLPSLFGLDLLSNASVFLQSVGIPSSTSLLMMMAGIVCGIMGNAVGIWILTRVGRRSATLVTLSIAGLLWAGMGISGFWQNDSSAYFSVGAMIAVIVVSSLGAWPAGFAISGETSSLRMRAKTQALGGVLSQAASVLMGTVLPMIFSPDQGALGAKTGFIYLGLCAVGAGMTWLWVPEMKGRSMAEIDHMFEMKLPARKFKSWRMEDHEMSLSRAVARYGRPGSAGSGDPDPWTPAT